MIWFKFKFILTFALLTSDRHLVILKFRPGKGSPGLLNTGSEHIEQEKKWLNLNTAYDKRETTDQEGQCYNLTLYHTIPTFNDPAKEVYLNHCGYQHFLLFPQGFQPIPKIIYALNLHIFLL